MERTAEEEWALAGIETARWTVLEACDAQSEEKSEKWAYAARMARQAAESCQAIARKSSLEGLGVK